MPPSPSRLRRLDRRQRLRSGDRRSAWPRRSSAARARAASARSSARESSSSASASESGASVVDGSASESVTGPGQSPALAHRDSRLASNCTRRITLSPQNRWPDGLWECAMTSLPSYGRGLLRTGEFSYRPCKTISVRFIVAMVAALIGVGALMPPTAAAGPTVCDYPACTPGIMPHRSSARRATTPPTTRSGSPADTSRAPHSPDG